MVVRLMSVTYSVNQHDRKLDMFDRKLEGNNSIVILTEKHSAMVPIQV